MHHAQASTAGRLASSLAALVTSDHHAGPHEVPAHLPVVPLVLALADIFFLFAIYAAAVIWPMVDPAARPPPPRAFYPGSDLAGLMVTFFFLTLTLWCFVLASAVDPGRVPKEWPWDPSKTEPREVGEDTDRLLPASTGDVRGVERKLDGRYRFCKVCNVYKPDRTHHCRKLGRCVLEMDHWCAWVRNTIGLRNKKFFFLLILYASTTLLCVLVTLGPYFVQCFTQPVNVLNVFIVIAYAFSLAEFSALGSFTCFHLYLAACAYSTIEFREKRGASEEKRTASGVPVNELYQSSPYDVGVVGNFYNLLGPYLMLWWLPVRWGMEKGVVKYKVQTDHPLARNKTA